MKLRVWLACMTAVISTCGSYASATAQESASSTPPAAKLTPGPEMAALFKILGHGAAWKGELPAGALGPNYPAMTSKGKASCASIVDGFWCLCELQDTMGSGKNAVTFRGHMTVGYDLGTKSYRATLVDNSGVLTSYNGQMGDGTFTLETPEPVSIMGTMMKDRLTFTAGPSGVATTVKDEHQGADGAWTTFETDHLTPATATHNTKKASATTTTGKAK